MTSVRRQDFIASHRSQEIPVAAASADPALAPVDVARADSNGDGFIRGDRELDALFSRIDRFDNDGNRNSVATPAGSRVLGMLNALQRNTQAISSASSSNPSALGVALSREGERILHGKTQGHLDAIAATGIGTHFGDHSNFAALSSTEKQQFLQTNAKPGTTPGTPRQSSCIGWAMENVGAAYAAAGKSTRWAEIERAVVRNGSKGTDLAKELQKDGWQAVYWNPDATTPADGNAEHSYSASQVRRGRPYYGIRIDAQVVNYRPSAGSTTTQDLTGLQTLEKIPFFFGLAKGGVHTFVGTHAQVNELHWAQDPTSTRVIEQTPLASWPWLSGVIMVPPGAWGN